MSHAGTVRQRLMLAGMLVLSTALMLGVLQAGHSWDDDFAGYVIQARALVNGDPRAAIDENRFTIETSEMLQGPTAYPWGAPILLAPLYAAFGLDMLALKALNVLSYLAFLVLVATIARRWYYWGHALVAVGLFALNPTMLLALNNVVADLPFLFASTASLCMITHVLAEGRTLVSRLVDGVLLGVLILLAFLLRTNGLLLLPTALAATMVQAASIDAASGEGRRFRTLVWLAVRPLIVPVAVFVAGAAIVWIALPEGGVSHLDSVALPSLADLRYRFEYYLDLPAEFYGELTQSALIYGASTPFVLMGLMTSRRRDMPMLAYAALTLLLYLAWPAYEGLRFLYPLLPIYVHLLVSGLAWLQHVAESAGAASVRWATVGIPLLVVAALSVSAGRTAYSNVRAGRQTSEGPFAATSRAAFAYLSDETPQDAVIMFFKPRAVRLLIGRAAFQSTRVGDLARADYLCMYLGERAYGQLPAGMVRDLSGSGALEQLYTNDDYAIYAIAAAE